MKLLTFLLYAWFNYLCFVFNNRHGDYENVLKCCLWCTDIFLNTSFFTCNCFGLGVKILVRHFSTLTGPLTKALLKIWRLVVKTNNMTLILTRSSNSPLHRGPIFKPMRNPVHARTCMRGCYRSFFFLVRVNPWALLLRANMLLVIVRITNEYTICFFL